MGTTMSYIQLKNRGFSKEELRDGLGMLTGGGERTAKDLERQMEALIGEELTPKDRMMLHFLDGMARAGADERPKVGCREGAEWLPFWQTRLCDGMVLSSADLGRLSKVFQTPVLAFSLFDSDVLCVSYRDEATGAAYDYARLPWEGYEEYDDEVYQLGFPEFLGELCPPERREKLRAVWEEDNEDDVFADDRMWKLMELLEMVVIDPEAEQFPEGYELVYAK